MTAGDNPSSEESSFQSSKDILGTTLGANEEFAGYTSDPTQLEQAKIYANGGWRSDKQKDDSIRARVYRREKERDSWRAFWHIKEVDTRGTFIPRGRYYIWRLVDTPVTWFRENVAEPLQDKYKRPYYHRSLPRVTEIDDCPVTDWACVWEANEQYRLDKSTDWNMLLVLRNRVSSCMEYYSRGYQESTELFSPCAPLLEDYEENELNFFIKYGELGSEGDVRDAYMKQKHRLIWERRHPLVMEERKRVFEDHKAKLREGIYDGGFWKAHLGWYQDKKMWRPPYRNFNDRPSFEGNHPISKDWEYYKKKAQDGPDSIDPNEGYSGGFNLFPFQFLRKSPTVEDISVKTHGPKDENSE